MLVHQVIHDEPPSPRRFNGRVAPDMETIVLKCLEKEPGERYATAKDLSEDLTRFIGDRPILAKPITSLTRSLRWCRRNPVISGLSAGLLAVFLVGLTGVMTQWIRAEHEADRRRRLLYVSDMNAALLAWNENNVTLTQQLLERNRPGSQHEDLRGFEWFHLWHLSSEARDAHRVTLPDGGWSVSFVPGGETLAVGHAFSRTVTFWDVKTRKRRQRFGEKADSASWAPTVFAVSPDGAQIAYTAGDNRQLVVRSLSTHGERCIASNGRFLSVSFSPDSACLATGESDGKVRIWNLSSLAPQDVFLDGGHVAFSPNGRLLVTGSVDSRIRIWNREAQTEEIEWECEARIGILTFSPNGALLAASCLDKKIRVYNVATREQVAVLDFGGANVVYSVCFSPDSSMLAWGGTSRVVHLHDTHEFTLLRTLKGHVGSVTGLAFSPDGNMLASSSLDHTISLWDVRDAPGSLPVEFPGDEFSATAGTPIIALLPESQTVLRTCGSRVELLNLETSEIREVFTQLEAATSCVAVSAKNLAAVADMTGKVVLRTVNGGADLRWIRAGTAQVSSLAFSPSGTILAIGDHAGAISLWDAEAGERVCDLGDYRARICSLAFGTDGQKLVLTCWSGEVAVWDVASRKQDWEFDVGYGCGVLKAAYSPDGHTLATASQYFGTFLWDMTRSHPDSQRDVLKAPGVGLAFSPDGRTMYTGGASGDYTVKIWDLATHEQRFALAGHAGIVGDVLVTQDGSTLVSEDWSGTLRVWRAPRGGLQ